MKPLNGKIKAVDITCFTENPVAVEYPPFASTQIIDINEELYAPCYSSPPQYNLVIVTPLHAVINVNFSWVIFISFQLMALHICSNWNYFTSPSIGKIHYLCFTVMLYRSEFIYYTVIFLKSQYSFKINQRNLLCYYCPREGSSLDPYFPFRQKFHLPLGQYYLIL